MMEDQQMHDEEAEEDSRPPPAQQERQAIRPSSDGQVDPEELAQEAAAQDEQNYDEDEDFDSQ